MNMNISPIGYRNYSAINKTRNLQSQNINNTSAPQSLGFSGITVGKGVKIAGFLTGVTLIFGAGAYKGNDVREFLAKKLAPDNMILREAKVGEILKNQIPSHIAERIDVCLSKDGMEAVVKKAGDQFVTTCEKVKK